MEGVVVPCQMGILRRVKSKQIVEAFIALEVDKGIVDVSQTGRSFEPVYNTLFQYVAKHPDLGVKVVRESGDIILYRDSIRKDSTLDSSPMGTG